MPAPDRSAAPRRRRVSAQRYWIRRAGALVVVGAIVYSLVRVAGSLVGGDGGEDVVVAESAPGTEAVDGESAAEGAIGVADAAAAASIADTTSTAQTTTEPEPEATGPPTAENPGLVYIVGDSDAGTFGPYLQTLLDATNIVDTELNYKVSSGLARPDFFDWPSELAARLPEVDPDIVVVTFGGNDSQGLSLPQPELEFVVGDPSANEAAWTEEYRRRVGEVLDLLLEDGRRVIWVGIPNDDNPEVTAKLAIQDQAVRAEIDERAGQQITFVDTWQRFSGRDGNWAEFVIDPRDGEGKDVRADDGFHLNTNGAEILAIDIAVAVRDALRDMGATI